MPVPQFQVDVAFPSTPLATTPTWVPIPPDKALSFSTRRGRSQETEHVEAGTATVELDNRDRRFDPTYQGTIANRLSNPSFETNTSDWLVFNGGGGPNPTLSLSTDATFVQYGAKALYITADNTEGVARLKAVYSGTPIGVATGDGVYLRAYVSGDATSTYPIYLGYRDQAGNITQTGVTGVGNGITKTASGNGFLMEGTLIVPAGVTTIQLAVWKNAPPSTTSYVAMDAAMVGPDALRSNYVDGDQDNARWSGTRHASTSYLGGPYYGNILPGKRARLRERYPTKNLVPNSSFEDGQNGAGGTGRRVGGAWTTTLTGTSTLTFNTDPTDFFHSRSGSGGRVYSQRGASVGSAVVRSDLFPIDPSKDYTLTGYFRTWTGSGAQATIRLVFFTRNGDEIGFRWPDTAVSGVTYVNGHFDPPALYTRYGGAYVSNIPPEAVQAKVEAYLHFDPAANTGTVLDAVQVETGTSATGYEESILYGVFDGYVEQGGWQFSRPSFGDQRATMNLVDGMAKLASSQVETWPTYPEVVAEMEPWGYWRLNDLSATTVKTGGKAHRMKSQGRTFRWRDPVYRTHYLVAANGTEGQAVNSPAFRQTGGTEHPIVSGDPDSYGMGFTAASSQHIRIPVPDAEGRPGATNQLTVSALFRPKSVGAAQYLVAGPYNAVNASPVWGLFLTATGQFEFFIYTTGAVRLAAGGTTTPLTTAWYQVTGTWDGTNVQLFVDGVREGSFAGAGATLDRGDTGRAVYIGGSPVSPTPRYANAYISDAFVSDQALAFSSTAGERLEDARAAGYGSTVTTQTSNLRIGDVTGTALPSGLYDYQTGTINVAPQRKEGDTRLAMVQEIERTEDGLYFIGADGREKFKARTWRDSPTSLATFGNGSGEVPFSDVTLNYGDILYNSVTVTRRGGIPQTATDTTSISTHGEFALPGYEDTLFLTDAEALTLAQRLRDRYKDPALRITSIDLDGTDASALSQLLIRELGDYVTVTERPLTGTATTQASFVEAIEYAGEYGRRTGRLALSKK
jgi:hypothetical protein